MKLISVDILVASLRERAAKVRFRTTELRRIDAAEFDCVQREAVASVLLEVADAVIEASEPTDG